MTLSTSRVGQVNENDRTVSNTAVFTVSDELQPVGGMGSPQFRFTHYFKTAELHATMAHEGFGGENDAHIFFFFFKKLKNKKKGEVSYQAQLPAKLF